MCCCAADNTADQRRCSRLRADLGAADLHPLQGAKLLGSLLSVTHAAAALVEGIQAPEQGPLLEAPWVLWTIGQAPACLTWVCILLLWRGLRAAQATASAQQRSRSMHAWIHHHA